MHHPGTYTNEWRPTASTLCPVSLPHKKKHKKVQEFERTTPENFLATGGCFNHNTQILCQSTRLAKERKKKKERNKEIWPPQQFLYTITATACRLGSPYKLYYTSLSVCPSATANTVAESQKHTEAGKIAETSVLQYLGTVCRLYDIARDWSVACYFPVIIQRKFLYC